MRTYWFCLLILLSNPLQAQLSEQQFNRPETVYSPRVFWQWMNGNITREGINLDLEAMAATGIGHGILFNSTAGIPQGPVTYHSAEWTERIVHALQQADRLGLQFLLHNAPGYSGTGGPWISPENAMQQVVWSEATVKGGEPVSVQLPKPFAKQGFYKDIAVLAYPSLKGEEQPFRNVLQSITLSGKPVTDHLLTDFDFSKSIFLDRVPAELVLRFSEPIEAACFIVHREKTSGPSYDETRDDPPTLQLEFSHDGVLYTKVCELPTSALKAADAPAFVNFPTVKAPYYRIRSNKPTYLTEIELVPTPRIEGWDWKTNYLRKSGTFCFDPVEPSSGFVISAAKVVDLTNLTSDDGRLNWSPPKGNWTIVRIGCTITGQVQAGAPQACIGLDVDKLSRYGVQQHVEKFLKPLFAQTRPHHGRSFEGLTIDHWEVGEQNWTRDMLPEFQKRAGYDLKTYLLAFTGRYVNSALETERFLWDLRRVQQDMMKEYFYDEWRDQLQKEGLSLLMGNFQPRESSRFAEYPAALKTQVDYQLSQRQSLASSFDFEHQPHPSAQPGMVMGPFGNHLNRNNTWFSKATNYFECLSRSQYVLQSGVFVADAAFFMGEEVVGPAESQVQTPGHVFDVLTRDELLEQASTVKNKLVLPNGMSYRFLVFPELKIMSLPVLRKLKALLEDGLWISAIKPTAWPGQLTPKEQAEWQSLVEDLWSKLPHGVYRYGSGRLFIHVPVEKIMEEAKLNPDFGYTSSNPNALIHFQHRRIGTDEVWFVCNSRRQNDTILASFRIIGMQPEWWNPQTGTIRILDIYRQHDEQTFIPLTLEPSESGFVVFRKPIEKPVFDGLTKDDVPLLSANPDHFTQETSNDLKSNFSLTLWAKPDQATKNGRSYLLYPKNGAETYGAGHASFGLSISSHGIRLYEHELLSREVLNVPAPLQGWTLINIIYKNNTPIVYINGERRAEGKKSVFVVHSNPNELAPVNPLLQLFQGENTRPWWTAQVLDSATVRNLYAQGRPSEPLPQTLRLNGNRFFRQKGSYSLQNPGAPQPIKADLILKKTMPIFNLSSNWLVRFPEGKGAPEQFRMDSLISLHLVDTFGIKHFSGTATWLRSFDIEPKDLFGNHFILDLGQVANTAELYVNGKSAGLSWRPPHRTEVTNLLRPGENQLEIRVTNLWVNRLIGDEALPAENQYDAWGKLSTLPDWYTANQSKTGERIGFVTWKQYDKNAPLVESGLIGPVTLSVWKVLKE